MQARFFSRATTGEVVHALFLSKRSKRALLKITKKMNAREKVAAVVTYAADFRRRSESPETKMSNAPKVQTIAAPDGRSHQKEKEAADSAEQRNQPSDQKP